MVLPNATLFPHTLLPLYIFEQRYRAMLTWTLERHRLFCVALMKPGVNEAASPGDFHQIAGLGLVRACVEQADGTSHLVLQGLARVRFTGYAQEAPFRVAEITQLPPEPSDGDEAKDLASHVVQLCSAQRAKGVELPEAVEQQLAKLSDPEVLGDVVAQSFLRDPQRRQEILEQRTIGNRLRLLIHHLNAEMGSP